MGEVDFNLVSIELSVTQILGSKINLYSPKAFRYRTVPGRQSLVCGGRTCASVATALKTNEENVPDVYEGEPLASPSGKPRPVHW